jgi:hypothetical protein
MKTVFVYINTATQLGDVDYVKVFANVEGLPKGGLRNMTLKASRSSMTFGSKPHRPSFWHFSKRNLEAASVGGLFSSPRHRQSCAPCVAWLPRHYI